MRSTLLALALVALVACKTCGQLTVDVVKYQELTGLPTPTLIGSKVLVESLNLQSLSVRSVALVMVGSNEAEVRVEGSDVNRNSVRLEKLDDGAYFVSSPGKTWVDVREYAEFEINGVKRKFLVDQKSVVIELGPVVPPGPDPKPGPPVPPDEFGNIGQRVATWSAGLPKRKEIAAIYKAGAVRLKTDLQSTVNIVTAEMKSQQISVLGAVYSSYKDLFEKVNADLNSRWPMTKGTLADYCTAVALGLEAQ